MRRFFVLVVGVLFRNNLLSFLSFVPLSEPMSAATARADRSLGHGAISNQDSMVSSDPRRNNFYAFHVIRSTSTASLNTIPAAVLESSITAASIHISNNGGHQSGGSQLYAAVHHLLQWRAARHGLFQLDVLVTGVTHRCIILLTTSHLKLSSCQHIFNAEPHC